MHLHPKKKLKLKIGPLVTAFLRLYVSVRRPPWVEPRKANFVSTARAYGKNKGKCDKRTYIITPIPTFLPIQLKQYEKSTRFSVQTCHERKLCF